MNIHTFHRVAAAALLSICASASFADDIRSGTIGFHNDVVSIDFTLNSGGAFSARSTSWNYGVNFDPAAGIWQWTGSDYTLVSWNDDDDLSAFDPAGNFNFRIDAILAAGNYRLTLVASPNSPSGTLLSQGFAADGETPIALIDWTQPGSNPNFPDQKGGFYSITFAGADTVAPVPEPATWLILGAGLAGMLGRRRIQGV
jgi:hypothetical protein